MVNDNAHPGEDDEIRTTPLPPLSILLWPDSPLGRRTLTVPICLIQSAMSNHLHYSQGMGDEGPKGV